MLVRDGDQDVIGELPLARHCDHAPGREGTQIATDDGHSHAAGL
jgi:hypothetical protein